MRLKYITDGSKIIVGKSSKEVYARCERCGIFSGYINLTEIDILIYRLNRNNWKQNEYADNFCPLCVSHVQENW